MSEDTPIAAVTVVPPGGGELVNVLGHPMLLKANGSNAPLFVAEDTIAPGHMVPPHIHAVDYEAFYVLEGEVTLLGEGGETRAGAGSFVHLPAGVAHGFRNDTAGTLRLLVLGAPGAKLTALFRHLDRAGRAGPLTPDAVGAIAAEHAVRML